MDEPILDLPTLRACATPHSAPIHWMKIGAEPTDDPTDPEDPDLSEPEGPTAETFDDVASYLQRNPATLADFVERLSPDQERKDGWSPFLRKLFLQVLAETGLVSRACEYTGMSRTSAYNLAARDAMFSAGWEAAALLARNPLADRLYEQAVEGVTDTIVKDGKVVAERRRFDTRLSIAVLNRLDKRCDRAEERGSSHLAVMRNWDEWLRLLGTGDEAGARALVESAGAGPARQCQPCQLPESANPTGEASEDDEGLDLSDRIWRDELDGRWMTDFPPPPAFTGFENYPYAEVDANDEPYERMCTPDEIAILEADLAADRAAERAEDEALRDAWFALLRKSANGSAFAATAQGDDEGEAPPPAAAAMSAGT